MEILNRKCHKAVPWVHFGCTFISGLPERNLTKFAATIKLGSQKVIGVAITLDEK